MVEPFRLPFCAKDATHWFCISCFEDMYKVRPIRNNCPTCEAKFEPAKDDDPVEEKVEKPSKKKKGGKKKKGKASKDEDKVSIDPSVIKLYMMQLRTNDIDKDM